MLGAGRVIAPGNSRTLDAPLLISSLVLHFLKEDRDGTR
jgi:hypothetical protein